jgi:Fe-S oxidoreductase
MDDPVRYSWLGVPGVAWLWAGTLVSLGVFGLRARRYAATLMRARAENRFDRPLARLWKVAGNVFLQRKLVREGLIGPVHLVLFWAFMAYAATFAWTLARGLFPALPVPYPEQVPWAAAGLAVAGAAGLAGVAAAAARRYLFPPERLHVSLDGLLILGLIAAVLGTYLTGHWTPDEGVRTAMWWTHIAIVLGFFAYLPYSKHLHLLLAPFSVYWSDLDGSRMPARSEGARRVEEFTWRQLVSGLACAECGRCDRDCPAHLSGAPLSPRELMEAVRDAARRGAGDVAVNGAAVWACTTCGACGERCMCFNEHIPLIVEMRRKLVAEGAIDPALQGAFTRLNRYGNSMGLSGKGRAKWTQQVPFPIPDARKRPVEVLWITGDYAALDPRLHAATAAAARLMQAAGTDFGILYEAEWNTGNDARRAGEEGLFEFLRDKNQAALGRCEFKRIVTTDPHALNVLRREYDWRNGHAGAEILHISELLDRLIQAGALSVQTPAGLAAAYHDPCYLGRYNGIYDAPRRVLKAIGVRLVELPRSRERSFCCGAGGGRIWMEDSPEAKERPAEARVREAAGLAGVSTLITACPKDYVMFLDAVKTTGLEGKLAVRDLAEAAAGALVSGKEVEAHGTA